MSKNKMFKLTLELDPEYRCDEVEKKDEETRRKKIEEQLTQALIRY